MFHLHHINILFPEDTAQAAAFEATRTPFVLIAQRVNGEGIYPKKYPAEMKAVLAEQFDADEHLALIRSGIMPLLFKFSMNRNSLQMKGNECLDCMPLTQQMKSNMDFLCRMVRQEGISEEFVVKCGIETQQELADFQFLLPHK